MSEGTYIEDHLTIFKIIIGNLDVMKVEYAKEDLKLILLCSLPSSYMMFRDTIPYSCDTLTIDEVYGALLSNEKINHPEVGSEGQVKGLVVHRKSQDKSLYGYIRGRSKLRLITFGKGGNILELNPSNGRT